MSDKSEFRGNDYMPIYEPKDYEDVIARIQKKVIEKNMWEMVAIVRIFI